MSNEHLKPHLQACLDASTALTSALQRLHHALGQPIPNGGQVSASGDSAAVLEAAATEYALGPHGRRAVRILAMSTSQKYSIAEVDEMLEAHPELSPRDRMAMKLDLQASGMLVTQRSLSPMGTIRRAI